MHTSMSLFDLSLPAAKADPETSRQAAREFVASGQRDRDVMRVAELVNRHPARTSRELATTMMAMDYGLDRYAIARRLPECERVKLVRRGNSRRCAVSGKQALTWLPVDDGSDLDCMTDA